MLPDIDGKLKIYGISLLTLQNVATAITAGRDSLPFPIITKAWQENFSIQLGVVSVCVGVTFELLVHLISPAASVCFAF